MEGSSLSPANGFNTVEIPPEFLSKTDDLEGELSPELVIKEEMIEEVMQELYREIAWSPSACSEERAASTPFLPLSPSFAEGGKSESCGAFMSDTASSVMAGLKFTGGLRGSIVGKRVGRAWEEELTRERVREEIDGCDEVELGDEWLEQVMAWTPPEQEWWT